MDRLTKTVAVQIVRKERVRRAPDGGGSNGSAANH